MILDPKNAADWTVLLWGLNKFAPTRVLEQIGYKEVVSYGKDCIATYQGHI